MAKVSDFGMSRVVESRREAIYSVSNVGPLRWMAPEALEKKKYSEKSDVWSFGVTYVVAVLKKKKFKMHSCFIVAVCFSRKRRPLLFELTKENKTNQIKFVKKANGNLLFFCRITVASKF